MVRVTFAATVPVLIWPAASAARRAFSISCCEVTPTRLRNLRMLVLRASSSKVNSPLFKSIRDHHVANCRCSPEQPPVRVGKSARVGRICAIFQGVVRRGGRYCDLSLRLYERLFHGGASRQKGAMAMFVLPAAIRAGNNGINRLSHNALHSRRQA